MNRVTVIVVACLVAGASVASAAERFSDVVDRGNEAFLIKDYKKALEQYQIAETKAPETPELDYNIANVLYHQGKLEEAVERYTRALNTTDIQVEAKGHYNLGNAQYRAGDFAAAIEQYQKALEINPDDVDAKFNLELARKMLKEQIKPEEQEQQQEQQEQQQEEQQQQQQENEEQQDQQQQNQQQNEQQDQQQQQQQQQEQQQQPMSKEDAERILNALKDDEQEIQKKIKRQRVGGNYTGKDW